MSKLADSLSEVRDLLQHLMTRPDISTVEAAEIFERENKVLMKNVTPLLARQQLIALAGEVARKHRRTAKHGDQLLLPELPALPMTIPIPGAVGKKHSKLRSPLSEATVSAVKIYCQSRPQLRTNLSEGQVAAERLLEMLAPHIKDENITIGEAIAIWKNAIGSKEAGLV